MLRLGMINGASESDLAALNDKARRTLAHLLDQGFAIEKVENTWRVYDQPHATPILYNNDGLMSQSVDAFNREMTLLKNSYRRK